MGRIVVSQFMTVDGIGDDPGGAEGLERGGWAFQFERGPEGDQFKYDEAMAAEALLLGRVTYEGFAAAWPSRTGEFADKYNGMPKYVVSSTLSDADAAWNNTTVIRGDVAAEIARLKAERDGILLVNGSTQLVPTLIDHDLVDEFRLMVFPVVLGAGRRLFGDTAASASLRLVDTTPAGECLVLTFEPKRSAS